MATDRFIVKVQRPIVTNGPPQVLIYNEDRSITVQVDMTKKFRKLFKVGEFKIYCEAEHNEAGTLIVYDRVKDQSW